LDAELTEDQLLQRRAVANRHMVSTTTPMASASSGVSPAALIRCSFTAVSK
jgi:hypothetical protein